MMVSFDKIDNKLKELLGVDLDKQLAFRLGVTPQYYHTSKYRKKILFEEIIALSIKEDLDLNCIFKNSFFVTQKN